MIEAHVGDTDAVPLPHGAGVDFEHHSLADGDVVRVGNTEVQAIATPGKSLTSLTKYVARSTFASDAPAARHNASA